MIETRKLFAHLCRNTKDQGPQFYYLVLTVKENWYMNVIKFCGKKKNENQ